MIKCKKLKIWTLKQLVKHWKSGVPSHLRYGVQLPCSVYWTRSNWVVYPEKHRPPLSFALIAEIHSTCFECYVKHVKWQKYKLIFFFFRHSISMNKLRFVHWNLWPQVRTPTASEKLFFSRLKLFFIVSLHHQLYKNPS